MYLRRLEAQGFKSFADRQRFEFGPGLTSIVGPNGSGKSNVADAIRWALGEQSSRAIRARKTEDVIFSGSDLRRPMGAAEVTLTLDNSDQWMPVEFREVTVTRRAYRSGENEYLINGSKVRLMDVQDLFRRAKVGQNSYAMMSQGLVDEVLALRPLERRDLIEEAADVHRHRIELTRAERRLAQTRDNLGHVRVLIRQLAPRLRQLERQTERARRYKEFHSELMAALEVYYEHELRQTNEALTAARARHDQVSTAFASARADEERFKPLLQSVRQRVIERRDALETARTRERELSEEALRVEQARALAEQRLELLQERRTEVEQQIADAAGRPENQEAAIDPVALDAAVAEADTALAREREALASADDAVRGVLRELAEAEARRARFQRELEDSARELARIAREQQTREEGRSAAAERREALKERLRSYGQQALDLHREEGGRQAALIEARSRRERAERRVDEEQRALAEASEQMRAITAVAEQLESRHSMIETLSSTVVNGQPAAQALLEAARDAAVTDGSDGLEVTGVVGLMSRLLRVPQGLEQAIEAALAEQLTAIVVEGHDDALVAIEYLREQRAGAVTIYPLDSIQHTYPLNLFNERGVVGVASRLVRVEQRYRALVDTLLGRVIVVEDIETAQRMIRRGLGAVVTRDGVLLRPGGAVYGGSVGSSPEQFELQRELEELPDQVAAARQEQTRIEVRVGRQRSAVDDARDAVTAARRTVDAAEGELRDHSQRRSTLRRGLVGIAGQLRAATAALTAAEAETTERQQELRERRRAAEAALSGLGETITDLRDRSEAVGGERDVVAERVSKAATSLATARGEQESARRRQSELEDAHRAAREQLEQRRAIADSVRREIEDLEHSLLELRTQLANARSAQTTAVESVAPAHARLAEATTEEHELSSQRSDAQSRLLTAERQMIEAQAELRESAAAVQRIEQRLADDGLMVEADGTVRIAPSLPKLEDAEGEAETTDAAAEVDASDPVDEREIVPARGGADIDPEELRARIGELRGQIRDLGPVNVDALEDLSEEREQHDFLSGQVNDLEAAEEQLRAAIVELRQLIRTRFDETFAEVNRHFGSYFTRFFGGGSAELLIVQDEEGGEPGVEIRAQPPGKRISSLGMLSGGERALTSVSLLFALLAVNPAPVCVLDEVDAALDEANVGRFVDTLSELYERSQFIVITHNRRTVQQADNIYGVSMGEDSTSEVLSMRLGEFAEAS